MRSRVILESSLHRGHNFLATLSPLLQRPDRYAQTLASRRYSGFSIVSPDSRAEKLGNRVGCPPTSAREPNKFDDHQHTRGSSSTYLPRTMIGSRGKHEQIECCAVTGFPAVSENYRTTGGHSIWKLLAEVFGRGKTNGRLQPKKLNKKAKRLVRRLAFKRLVGQGSAR